MTFKDDEGNLKLADPRGRAAVGWMVAMTAGTLSPDRAEAFEKWRQADPLNAKAWSIMVGGLDPFDVLARSGLQSGRVAHLDQAIRLNRRSIVTGLVCTGGAVALSSAVGNRFVPIADVFADHVTRTAEQKSLTLKDGSQLILGPRTAVDVHIDREVRSLELLSGELYIVVPEGDRRAFNVRNRDVELVTYGGGFGVSRVADRTVLYGSEGQGMVTCGDATLPLGRGDQITFAAGQVIRERVDTSARVAWTRGILIVDNIRLAEIADRFRPYYAGFINVDSSIEDRHATGVLNLFNPKSSFDNLARSLEYKVSSIGDFYLYIGPRSA